MKIAIIGIGKALVAAAGKRPGNLRQTLGLQLIAVQMEKALKANIIIPSLWVKDYCRKGYEMALPYLPNQKT